MLDDDEISEEEEHEEEEVDKQYLMSPEFESRYILAASWLRNCRHVIQVGEWQTPICAYFFDPCKREISVIDPNIEVEPKELEDQAFSFYGVEADFLDTTWQKAFTPAKRSQGFVCLDLDFDLVMDAPTLQFMKECHHLVIGAVEDCVPSLVFVAEVMKVRNIAYKISLRSDEQLDQDLYFF